MMHKTGISQIPSRMFGHSFASIFTVGGKRSPKKGAMCNSKIILNGRLANIKQLSNF